MTLLTQRRLGIFMLSALSFLLVLFVQERWERRYSPEALRTREVQTWLKVARARQDLYQRAHDGYASRFASLSLEPYTSAAWRSQLLAARTDAGVVSLVEVENGSERLAIDQDGTLYVSPVTPLRALPGWQPEERNTGGLERDETEKRERPRFQQEVAGVEDSFGVPSSSTP